MEDDGWFPNYYCSICGTVLNDSGSIDAIDTLPTRMCAWIREDFKIIARGDGTENDGRHSEGLLRVMKAVEPIDIEVGVVHVGKGYVFHGVTPPEESNPKSVFLPQGLVPFRLVNKGKTENRMSGAYSLERAYPMHDYCWDTLQTLIERSGRAGAFNTTMGRESFLRLLSSLEDEVYPCRLDPSKFNNISNNYLYGGAEQYIGARGEWDVWSEEHKRHDYDSLPMGWKYLVDPTLYNDFVGGTRYEAFEHKVAAKLSQVGMGIGDAQSDEKEAMKLKFDYSELKRQQAILETKFMRLLKDAFRWDGNRYGERRETDGEVLAATMHMCFLSPEKSLGCTYFETTNDLEKIHDRIQMPAFRGMAKLPSEIILQIISYLPTPCIIHGLGESWKHTTAATASNMTCLIPPVLPTTFWKTRFQPGFEIYCLYPELRTAIFPLASFQSSSIVDFKPSDRRTLYHYLGTLSDLKSNIKYPLRVEHMIEWTNNSVDMMDGFFEDDPEFDVNGEDGWTHIYARSACLSNRKRIHKCAENLLEIYDRFVG